ncbi:MAG: hypothetical protein HYS22_09025 [Deltaproteobacteria bacterium]|nr:hypothetical protein [Deltaproteobacteria bacterium]
MRSPGVLFLLFLFSSPGAWGAGPILVDVDNTGQAVVFKDGSVTYNPETSNGDAAAGKLGRLSNAEALALVDELFKDWKNITLNGTNTVSLNFTAGTGLGNVDEKNVNNHFAYCPPTSLCPDENSPFILGSARSGQNPILFDEDGKITDLIQGQGSSNDILGFAGPRVVQQVGGTLYITEAQAVLNGKWIDCPAGAAKNDPCRTPEEEIDAFKGAIFHELGHFLGLDHVDVNDRSALKAAGGDMSEASAIATMYPLYIDGKEQLTPHYDDKVSASMLYPTVDFANAFCTIQGKVFESNGTTELQGVNVVARNIENSLEETITFVSGAFYKGSFTDCDAKQGDYYLKGIIPGKQYSLEIEKVNATFTGGSSVEPCDPPASGFDNQTISGTFSCAKAGEVVTGGSVTTTTIVTTKSSSKTPSDDEEGGGCSLIP